MRNMRCMDCRWCAILDCKDGSYGRICTNNVDWHYPEAVDLLQVACDGFYPDIEDEGEETSEYQKGGRNEKDPKVYKAKNAYI